VARKRECADRTIRQKLFPFLAWACDYDRASLRGDAMAGLTTAVVLIPQSMAYAMLAGLPAVYGLYAAAVAPLAGALWGSLRQLATGPIAIMSLLVLTTLSPLAAPGSREYIELALLLSLMVGVLYLGVGIFRLGEVMSFISHSAVKGFTAAAALIIIATQLPHLLGIHVERHEYIVLQLLNIAANLPQFDPATLLVGGCSFLFIHFMKTRRPHFPAGLVALTVAALTVSALELDIAIVGPTPGGLPRPQVPPLDFEVVSALIGPAVVIGVVSFAETYSVGKAISARTRQKLDVNQEFIGQGMANLVGAFFQAYPVSGSFSRTAINYTAGARTGISSAISSIIVVVALLFLTGLFTYIPRAALAALVISAVLILFHPKEVFSLWKLNHHDGVVAILGLRPLAAGQTGLRPSHRRHDLADLFSVENHASPRGPHHQGSRTQHVRQRRCNRPAELSPDRAPAVR
jgi:SulP family sulfate permease